MINDGHRTVYDVQCTVYSIRCTVYGVQSSILSVARLGKGSRKAEWL